MRTYLILAEKARQFALDSEIQEALRTARAPSLEQPTTPAGGLSEILGSTVDESLWPHRVWARAARSTCDGVAARSPIVPLVVGVDSSTSACKVQVRDAESGRLVSTGQASHPADEPTAQRAGAREWWRAFEAACGQADVQKHGPAG